MQVEHPVTEAVYPDLDIVELMVLQGIYERDSPGNGLSLDELDQERYIAPSLERQIHAIEARVYCENPAAGFKPAPGVLQRVHFLESDWLRVETWVSISVANIYIYHSDVRYLGRDRNDDHSILRSSCMQAYRNSAYT